MDKNPRGNNITMFHLVQIAMELTREMQSLKTYAQLATRNQSERIECEWLNSLQIMSLLKIKKVTLQKLRDEGTLPHSNINGKFYYKAADVDVLLNSNYRKVNNKKVKVTG